MSNTHVPHLELFVCVCSALIGGVYMCPIACPTFVSSQDSEWVLEGRGTSRLTYISSLSHALPELSLKLRSGDPLQDNEE